MLEANVVDVLDRFCRTDEAMYATGRSTLFDSVASGVLGQLLLGDSDPPSRRRSGTSVQMQAVLLLGIDM